MASIKNTVIKDNPKNRYFLALELFKKDRTQKVTTLAMTLIALSFFGLFAINPTLSTISRLQKELEDAKFVDQHLKGKEPTNLGDVIMTISKVIHDLFITPFHHFPKRLSAGIQYIITTQYRFALLSKKRHFKPHFFDHKEFHNAFTFYQLRAICDESLREGYLEWKKHYESHSHKKLHT